MWTALSSCITRRDELLKAYGKRAERGNNRFTDRQADSVGLQTTAEIAESMGVSPTVYREEKRIATNILPEAQEAIKAADLLLQAGYPST